MSASRLTRIKGGLFIRRCGSGDVLYGPLIDAPHLWATIARTYTDAGEWTERRRLLLGSLVWFLIGPGAILLPYALRAVSAYPAGDENLGWTLWSQFCTFYALYHINQQHRGFVALYRRKNGEAASEPSQEPHWVRWRTWPATCCSS